MCAWPIATSIEKIAEAAGSSTGAAYSNFGGKEGMFFAALSAEGGAHMAALLAPLTQADSLLKAGTGSGEFSRTL